MLLHVFTCSANRAAPLVLKLVAESLRAVSDVLTKLPGIEVPNARLQLVPVWASLCEDTLVVIIAIYGFIQSETRCDCIIYLQ